ncbi:hypothetical protein [Glutamicibacter sp. NPDC087673]|uniref:hypothetical protein n=1 Tax=Glutamicibacter sp. NPDC087673 TaxID=3363997 RepID=UPI00380D250F
MSGDSVRSQIADRLKEFLPDYVIDDYPADPDQVLRGRPYVDVYGTEITGLGENQLAHTVTINVMAVAGTPALTEDALETARDNVLIVLTQHMPGVFPQRAERQTFLENTYSGYGITVTAYSSNAYKKAEVTP